MRSERTLLTKYQSVLEVHGNYWLPPWQSTTSETKIISRKVSKPFYRMIHYNKQTLSIIFLFPFPIMKLTINVTSQKLFLILENLIIKVVSNTDKDGKYIYYRCREDFLESVYHIALYVSNLNTDIDYNPWNDWNQKVWDRDNVAITTWISNSVRRYKKTFEFEDNFIYQ